MNWIRCAAALGILITTGSAWAQSATNLILTLAAGRTTAVAPGQPLVLQLQAPAAPRLRPVGPLKSWPVLNSATNSTPPGPPAPGLYKTTPFSCLVLVPSPHLDERCIIGSGAPGPGTSSMPTVKPDLQFHPYAPGK